MRIALDFRHRLQRFRELLNQQGLNGFLTPPLAGQGVSSPQLAAFRSVRELLLRILLRGSSFSKRTNLRYFTGFIGSSGICLITPTSAFFYCRFLLSETA